MVRLRELAAVDVLKAYRQQSERLRDEELQKPCVCWQRRQRRRCAGNWPVA